LITIKHFSNNTDYVGTRTVGLNFVHLYCKLHFIWHYCATIQYKLCSWNMSSWQLHLFPRKWWIITFYIKWW